MRALIKNFGSLCVCVFRLFFWINVCLMQLNSDAFIRVPHAVCYCTNLTFLDGLRNLTKIDMYQCFFF